MATRGEAVSSGWGRAALAAALGALAMVGIEELRWTLRGRPSAPVPLLVGAAILAVACALMAAGLALLMPGRRALPIGLALAPAGALAAGWNGYEQMDQAVVVGLAACVGVAGAAAVAVMATRRRGLALLGAAAASLAWPAGREVLELLPAIPTHEMRATGHPDIVLIVMDTTRRDHLMVYGYPRPTTPHLEAFARDAEVYEDAWSVAPWTPSSHASLLTGLLPAQHGVDGAYAPPFPRGPVTLQRVLRQAGYRRGGFVANTHLTAPGWSRDFDEYHAPFVIGKHSLLGWLKLWQRHVNPTWPDHSAGRIFEQVREFWQQNEGWPRFVFVNLLEPHRPYQPPPDLYERFLPGVPADEAARVSQEPADYLLKPGLTPRQAEILNGLYDGDLCAMDREIGAFMTWLGERGELDHTIVAVTADHGERLGERGLVGHDLLMDPWLLRVPLIVRYPPAIGEGTRVARRVQTHGLPGYLLHLAGLHASPAMEAVSLEGQDLSLVAAQFQSPEWFMPRLLARSPGLDPHRYLGDWYFLADDRYAYSCSTAPAAASSCFLADLRDDPLWTRSVADLHPDLVKEFERRAAELPPFSAERARVIDNETREHLRSLGYLN
jgi:arylsulfatase A-like enzyme